ncbi:hypothetical protein BH11CYA1_BH11CYA1_47910 [soil metagenome]
MYQKGLKPSQNNSQIHWQPQNRLMIKKHKSKKGNLLIENVIEPARTESRSFAKAYPEAARQWLYEKNCGFGPEDFSFGSSVKCWFKCPSGKDHIFQSALSTVGRSWKNGSWTQACAFCRGLKPSVTNSLAKLHPELVPEWVKSLNDCDPTQISFGSNYMAWWRCKKRHTWQAIVCNRTVSGSGCPRCNKGAPIDLSDYPDVLAEFDQKKNKGIDPHALPTHVKVRWTCAVDSTHADWISGYYRTTKQSRCPSCTNKVGSKGNNLKVSHPEFAKQWDKEKNGTLKPTMVTAKSGRRVHWKCKEGPDHEWSTKVADHTTDMTGCPFCCFRKTSITNVLTTLAPQIAKEWHPKKNGKATPDQERVRSRTIRWWQCRKCALEWTAEPQRRYERNSGCPRCAAEKSIKHMLDIRGVKKRKLDMSNYA